ncbi:hypothetical protein MJD09_05580, partial [bacterium]|nr:hypothetical protein [bacterium]
MNSNKNGLSTSKLYSLTKMTGSPIVPAMKRHLDTEIRAIKESIIRMGGMVEHAIDKAIRSLKERDAQLAQEVINDDARINDLEIQIESDCRSLLALHQPVANDLRFIMASVKINNDLERMGD